MDALPHYLKSMELNPDDRDSPCNYLLCHMYIPDMDPKLVFEEHKKWGLSTTKKFPPAFKFKSREAGGKIRLGFLSADLCHHPVAHFIEPIFREYDRERFEIVAYGDQRKSDDFSARFATQVDLWRETSSYDDKALAKLIHEDRGHFIRVGWAHGLQSARRIRAQASARTDKLFGVSRNDRTACNRFQNYGCLC